MDSNQQLLERVAVLERRVLALEAKLFHKGGLGRAVRDVVSRWPGPFTAAQIREAVYEFQPDLKPVTEHHQVVTIIHRMEKAGLVMCTFRGAGPNPNIFVRTVAPPVGAGKSGSRFGSKHENESGFRSIVRAALDELPGEFTIADLRNWVANKAPSARVPYGSWSSTLYKMQQQQELVVVRNGGRAVGLKVYARGPPRISPTGGELQELEQAWSEFRKDIVIPDGERLTSLQRGDAL